MQRVDTSEQSGQWQETAAIPADYAQEFQQTYDGAG